MYRSIAPQQLLHPLYLQGGAEVAGKDFPAADQVRISFSVTGSPSRYRFISSSLHRASSSCISGACGSAPKSRQRLSQFPPDLLHERLPVCARLIHLVDKQKNRHPVMLQQLPKGVNLPLNSICPADYQQSVVQHPQSPFPSPGKNLRGRGVQQSHLPSVQGEFACLENMVIPLALSMASVSRKAS